MGEHRKPHPWARWLEAVGEGEPERNRPNLLGRVPQCWVIERPNQDFLLFAEVPGENYTWAIIRAWHWTKFESREHFETYMRARFGGTFQTVPGGAIMLTACTLRNLRALDRRINWNLQEK